MIGQGLDVDPRRAGRDHEYIGEEEGVLNVEQDNVGSILGEEGICCRSGQFDTVLYDGVSCLF
jgi:hypothetical protein